MKDKYNNYFKTHYNYSYNKSDLLSYRRWIYAQVNFINSKIKLNKNDKVLEIGSGIGGLYSYLKEMTDNYNGIELDKSAVKFSNKYFNSNNFTNISLEEFSGSKFDYIFALEVLEHLQDPIKAIGKIGKLLDKDGIFCGTSPYPFAKNVLADESHLYVLHPINWEKLFLMNGFKTVKLYPMSFLPFVWRINKRLNIRMPFYIPFSKFISTCLIIASK